jgi:hypothetical protein
VVGPAPASTRRERTGRRGPPSVRRAAAGRAPAGTVEAGEIRPPHPAGRCERRQGMAPWTRSLRTVEPMTDDTMTGAGHTTGAGETPGAGPSTRPARSGLVLTALILVAAVANLNLAVANVACRTWEGFRRVPDGPQPERSRRRRPGPVRRAGQSDTQPAPSPPSSPSGPSSRWAGAGASLVIPRLVIARCQHPATEALAGFHPVRAMHSCASRGMVPA